ncbi:MAG: hypothetical protein FJZ04_02740 [Candidatus Moranbacteria bacterium]|nr:hypothetical protein [Candidatus Moranbacteria bacterium]
MESKINIYGILESVLRCVYMRTVIMEEAEKIEQASSKKVKLQPFEVTESQGGIYEKYEKAMKKSLKSLTETNPPERRVLKDYVVALTENLRFQKYEDDHLAEDVKNYKLEEDKLKKISRDELGKLLIEMAKSEMEKAGFVPDKETLKIIYDEKFGQYLRYLDVFDLEILILENLVIQRTAERKQVENIARIAEAFGEYLETKKEEKEKRTRAFLAGKLGKMVK